MLEVRIIAEGQAISPFDLPAALGRRGAAKQIGDTIEGLIAFMDDLQGDIDLEDGNDAEPNDDAHGDISWTEWHTRGAHKQQGDAEPIMRRLGGSWLGWAAEDDEDDDQDTGVEDHPRGFDPEEDRCDAGDDHMIAGPVAMRDMWERYEQFTGRYPGDQDDAERACSPSYFLDQRRPLFVTAANDWPEIGS